MSFYEKAVQNFSWQMVLKIINYLVNFVKIYILARLLMPSDFGIFAIIVIAIGVTESLTQTGINVTIIQSSKSIKYYLDTAWTISIIRGFVIGIVMLFMSLALSHWYQQPELIIYISASALVPVIKGFINPQLVIVQKEMQFAKETIIRASLQILESVVVIIFASLSFAVWSFIIAIIFSALAEVLISFIFFEDRPFLRFYPERSREIMLNARWLSLSNLTNYLNENIDDFLIGKFTSNTSLGVYHNAYALSHKVNYELSKSFHHGVFPIFSKLSGQKQRLWIGFVKSLKSFLIMIIFTSLPLIIFSKTIIITILGEKWIEASTILPYLTIAGILQSFSMISYALFISLKQYLALNLHLIITLISLIVLIILLTPSWGLIGGALAVLLSRLVGLPIIIYYIYQISKLLNEKNY